MKRTRLHRPRAWTSVAILTLALVGGAWLLWRNVSTHPHRAVGGRSERTPPAAPAPASAPAERAPDPADATSAPAAAASGALAPDAVIGPDHFAIAAVHAERWLGAPDAGIRQRWRLATLAGESSGVARVVDHLARDAGGQHWRVIEQEVMRADAVVVAVPPGVTAQMVADRLRAAGFSPMPGHAGDAVIEVNLPDATLDAVPDALARLQATLPFLTAEPDFIRFPTQTTPNDYNAPVMWGLENIEAPGAWTISQGSTDVVVAVIDSGMEATHPDLAPNLWTNPGEIAGNSVDDDGNGFVDDVHGWNFAANNAAIIDNDGHGTHVSGTIGATGNNGQGATGVNWRVRLLPLRCGDGTFPDSALLNALRYVTALRARGIPVVAVNASFGGGGFSGTFRTEVANAGTAGILFVAAAGNDGTNNDTTPQYPASYDLDTIIAVASINQASGLSAFSDFGATSVDLGAPGTGIYSTLRNGTFGFNSGTSMAAPHVTGAVALVAAANPGLTAGQLRTRILQTVDPIPALAGRVATGGKLNLRRAVSPILLRPRVVITAPAARVIAIDRAGLGVALAATVQPDNGVTPSATLAWDAPEGTAGVSFSTTAGGSTVATFAANGRYRLRVRATAGTLQESDEVVVAVGSVAPDATGLHALWNFDEASGDALDTSGDNRTGTLTNVTRAPGVLGQAVSFNGTLGNIGFSAPALSRVTIAGWARASGAGGSIFPRVVHMRTGLLFFGLDSANLDDGNKGTLKFALDDGSATPVWHSPPGSVSTNTWYHVAVTYDPAAATPAPLFYINGAPQILGQQSAGAAGVPSVPVGQGYIGDRGDGGRVWQGSLDEIRIYDRELSRSELALLGHEVTLRALSGGTLSASVVANPLLMPLVFTPAATGLGAPGFAQSSWSLVGASATFQPASGLSTTMTLPGPGNFLVRFDATTTDGVRVVRTLSVTAAVDPVATPGYYTGTTTDGGAFTLFVDGSGGGTFLGGSQRGRFRRGFTVENWGGFSFTDGTGATVTGRIDATGGVTGTIAGVAFTGSRLTSGFGAADPARDGFYSGWVLDAGIRAGARVDRGRIAIVVEENGASRAAEGVFSASGTFALAPAGNASFAGAIGGSVLTADISLPGRAARRIYLLRDGFMPARRFVNLSLRGTVGSGDAVLIPGFVVSGDDPLPMLVRAVGPGLVDFDVAGFVAQPRLRLFSNSNIVTENFGWASATNAAAIAAATTRINAFALDPARSDSAVFQPLGAGAYTATVVSETGTPGIALAEAYDARLGGENARLVNLSGRGHVGTGDNILIGGFVVTGEAPALVLVRAAGPALTAFSVPGVLAQPELTVYRGQTAIATGAAWSLGEGATDVAAAIGLSHAFPFAANSADAALLLFLEPGGYTAQIRGANNTTGIALAEVYLVADF